jgi:hypothetical protein
MRTCGRIRTAPACAEATTDGERRLRALHHERGVRVGGERHAGLMTGARG